MGVWSGSVRASARLRGGAWALIVLLASAQVTLAFALYRRLDELAGPGPFDGWWLVSMVGAAIPPALLAGLLVALSRWVVGTD